MSGEVIMMKHGACSYDKIHIPKSLHQPSLHSSNEAMHIRMRSCAHCARNEATGQMPDHSLGTAAWKVQSSLLLRTVRYPWQYWHGIGNDHQLCHHCI